MAEKHRKFWGWGYEEDAPTAEHQRNIAALLAARLSIDVPVSVAPPTLDEIRLPDPRLAPPGGALGAICSASRYDRAGHTYGKAFRDVVRALRRDFAVAPAFVAFPTSESEVVALWIGAPMRVPLRFLTAAGRASSAASRRAWTATIAVQRRSI